MRHAAVRGVLKAPEKKTLVRRGGARVEHVGHKNGVHTLRLTHADLPSPASVKVRVREEWGKAGQRGHGFEVTVHKGDESAWRREEGHRQIPHGLVYDALEAWVREQHPGHVVGGSGHYRLGHPNEYILTEFRKR